MAPLTRFARCWVIVFATFTVNTAVLAQDWREVAKGELKVTFVLPELEYNIAGVVDWPGHGGIDEQSLWGDFISKTTPIAKIFARLSRGGYFLKETVTIDEMFDGSLKNLIEKDSYFSGKPIEWGDEGSTKNKLGKVKFARFSWAKGSCFSFSQIFGTRSFDNVVAAPANVLAGFYCDGPAVAVTDEKITSVLSSIRFAR